MNKRLSVQELLQEAYDVKGLPNDERAECSALVAISNDPTLFDQVHGSLLLPDYFSVTKYREIYEAMATIRSERNQPLSFITIGEELKRRGCQDLSVIVELSAQADPLPLPQIALYLRDLYQRRLMITQSLRMMHDCRSREQSAQGMPHGEGVRRVSLSG